jgi:SAM-dependent methyltransferase
MDWGDGKYEDMSADLLPAADVVVRAATLRPGERVVDLGCGDGNASLLAAAAGALVTGIDPVPRLLEIASARAAESGLEVTFVEGAAAAMPLPDAVADVILSVFGVIFAPDAGAAAREVARVAAPRGRMVLSAWRPHGALAEVPRLRREAVARANRAPATAGPPPFEWHEAEALRELFEPYGFSVSVADAAIAFTAPSAASFSEDQFRCHPGWIEARRVLDGAALAALRDRADAMYEDGNEDPHGFRLTSDYVVATLERR